MRAATTEVAASPRAILTRSGMAASFVCGVPEWYDQTWGGGKPSYPQQGPVQGDEQEQDDALQHGEDGPDLQHVPRVEVAVRVADQQHAALVDEDLAPGREGPDHPRRQRGATGSRPRRRSRSTRDRCGGRSRSARAPSRWP